MAVVHLAMVFVILKEEQKAHEMIASCAFVDEIRVK
jgi:hypothetical protein